MTLLSVIRDVCSAVGVTVPQSVFSNIAGNRTMTEMVSLANEMAQRIAYDTRDWQQLRKLQTYAGDDVTTAFDLPENFKRMLLKSNLWRSSAPMCPMDFIPDTDDWVQRRARNWLNSSYGEWTLYGGQLHIVPELTIDETAFFAYLDKNCIRLASGGYGDSFLTDSDSFALDERLLKLGLIWQWKASKGGAYAEDMSNYGDALARISGADQPAPILIGRRPRVGINVLFTPPVAP
jgi:hypothetical protein